MLKEEKRGEVSPETRCLSDATIERIDRTTQNAMSLLDRFKSQCCHLRAARISPHCEHYNQCEDLADKLNLSYTELGFVVEALIGTKNKIN